MPLPADARKVYEVYETHFLADEKMRPRLNFTSPVIPRVGDRVVYWVDYPEHIAHSHGCEDGEPIRITGRVVEVHLDYRRMRWGHTPKVVVTASVFLEYYTADLPGAPAEKGAP